MHTASILDSLRTAYLPEYIASQPLDAYVNNRDLRALAPDPTWADDYYPSVPQEVVLQRIDDWLGALGAPPLVPRNPLSPSKRCAPPTGLNCSNGYEPARTSFVRTNTFTTPHPLTCPGMASRLPTTLHEVGLLDFQPVTLDRLIDWLAETGRWPAGMRRTHDLIELGLPVDALTRAERAKEADRRRLEDARRRVTIDGEDMAADETNYGKIVDAIRAGIDDAFIHASGLTPLTEREPRRRGAPGDGRPGTTAARRKKPSDTQIGAIGLAGEVAALEWLKTQYPEVSEVSAWKSGYRNQVLGDGAGDDTLGYDLIVDGQRLRLMFEVKATTGDQTEFTLTDAEIARAQNLRKRERYEILYITHVFDGDLRRIHRLPNPLDRRHSRFYRPIGDGIRYRFDFQGDAQ